MDDAASNSLSVSPSLIDNKATTVRGLNDVTSTSQEKAAIGLDWDCPEDPDNPWNWPMGKRWFGTLVPGALCLLVLVHFAALDCEPL